ncbi:MAG: hypothetical protein K8T20_08065 [Planctomycetes bacterium]|nr:hypothetical protein [Planctomycetota bacterium]
MRLRRPDPPDSEIVWCMNLHKTHPGTSLQHLRESYPDSRLVLIVDGDSENLPRYQAVGREFRAQVLPGEPYFNLASGHRYVERVLRQGLAGPERYLFKIDPDTRIWRRFSWLPDFPCAFGTLETVTMAFGVRVGHPPNVQGGCMGYTREVIEGVLASGLLSSDRCVTNAASGWSRNKDCEHMVARGKVHDDFLSSWAVDAAGFPLCQHPEIASYWREAVPNENLAYVVTHPHKSMEAAKPHAF